MSLQDMSSLWPAFTIIWANLLAVSIETGQSANLSSGMPSLKLCPCWAFKLLTTRIYPPGFFTARIGLILYWAQSLLNIGPAMCPAFVKDARASAILAVASSVLASSLTQFCPCVRLVPGLPTWESAPCDSCCLTSFIILTSPSLTCLEFKS